MPQWDVTTDGQFEKIFVQRRTVQRWSLRGEAPAGRVAVLGVVDPGHGFQAAPDRLFRLGPAAPGELVHDLAQEQALSGVVENLANAGAGGSTAAGGPVLIFVLVIVLVVRVWLCVERGA